MAEDVHAWDALQRAVRIADDAWDLPSLVRPLLDLLGEISGLEATYLTRVEWDDELQVIELARNVGEGFAVPEQAEVPWNDTLCQLALEHGTSWNADVPGTWDGSVAARELGIVTYVSVPVEAGDERPYGTLCGASPRRVEEDPEVLPLLRLFALLIGDAITQQRLRTELAARAERAEQMLEERIRFTATVEHAMRTPLTVVQGWARTLRSRPGLSVEQVDDALVAIDQSAERLIEQLQDLLGEARAHTAGGDDEAVDVAALAEGLRPAVGPDRAYDVSGRLVLRTDRDALAVLVEHLVENALAHTPPGTPVRVHVGGDGDGGVLVVEDDGPGLPDRDDLFDPFVSADPQRPGTGLGLHIVRTVTEQLGGTVTTGAAPSGGARFTVRLPPREAATAGGAALPSPARGGD